MARYALGTRVYTSDDVNIGLIGDTCARRASARRPGLSPGARTASPP